MECAFMGLLNVWYIYVCVYFFSNVRFGSKIHCALMNRIFQRKYSDNYTMCLADLLNPVRYKQVLFKSEMDTSAADRTGQLEKDEADCLYIHRQDKRTGRREGVALIGCSSQCLCVLVCPLCLWAVSWSCPPPPSPSSTGAPFRWFRRDSSPSRLTNVFFRTFTVFPRSAFFFFSLSSFFPPFPTSFSLSPFIFHPFSGIKFSSATMVSVHE